MLPPRRLHFLLATGSVLPLLLPACRRGADAPAPERSALVDISAAAGADVTARIEIDRAARQIHLLGNRRIELAFGWDDGGAWRLLSLRHLPSNTEWAAPAAVGTEELEADLPSGRVAGVRRRDGFELVGVSPEFGRPRDFGWDAHGLAFAFRHAPSGLVFRLKCLVYADAPVFERWVEVENGSPAPIAGIGGVPSLAVALQSQGTGGAGLPPPLVPRFGVVPPKRDSAEADVPARTSEPSGRPQGSPLLHTVGGLHGGLPEGAPPKLYAAFTRESRPLDKAVHIASSTRSSSTALPWFALEDPATGNGLFGGLEWSGAWALDIEPAGGAGLLTRPDETSRAPQTGPTATRLRWTTTANRWTLKPGESFATPRAFLGCYAGGLENERQVLHDFVRRHLAPARPPAWPWVQYDTWFACNTNVNEADLKREADVAARVGCELFQVNAGWYLGSSTARDEFSIGVGAWREDPVKFPSGLRAFADHVRARGMRFGLWVEPERVDVKTQAVGGWQPEWLMETPDPKDRAAPCRMLCFGHRPVREWAKETLARVVETYGVDCLFWDNNLWRVCGAARHTHPPGQGEYDHILGVYEVMDDLRRRFPNLAIENCASGGNRIDYGILRHTDKAWVHDASAPGRRVRHHFLGTNEAFPAAYLTAWVTNLLPDEETMQPALPPDLVRYVFRSRMPGSLGIGVPVRDWPDALVDLVRGEIDTYKRLRALVRGGRCYHLTPQPRLTDRQQLIVPPGEGWTAIQFHDPDQGTGAVLVYRSGGGENARRIRLVALDPAAEYVVTLDGRESTRRGTDLATDGLAFETPNSKAAWVAWYAPSPTPR